MASITFEQLRVQLDAKEAKAVNRLKETVVHMRNGTLPKAKVIEGNHSRHIYYEDEELDDNFISTGLTSNSDEHMSV